MKVNLSKIATEAPKELDKNDLKKQTEKYIAEIEKLQELLFAEGKKSLLIVFQGMDASGKDGVTKNVLGKLNPQGVRVKSFKKPTQEELNHDYLWRVHQHMPEKGMIQVFNRSHYEDVLVTRVLGFTSDEVAIKRFEQINAFEDLLEQTGTKIIKFFLHIGKDKQKEKFLERLVDPTKHWKYNQADWETRKHFDQYLGYYEEVIAHCNKPEWIVVPSDNNWYKEYLTAKEIYETLVAMNLSYPALPANWKNDAETYKNA
jgi:PPK2 family polyphosphate:nucleotide phosphotransferase